MELINHIAFVVAVSLTVGVFYMSMFLIMILIPLLILAVCAFLNNARGFGTGDYLVILSPLALTFLIVAATAARYSHTMENQPPFMSEALYQAAMPILIVFFIALSLLLIINYRANRFFVTSAIILEIYYTCCANFFALIADVNLPPTMHF